MRKLLKINFVKIKRELSVLFLFFIFYNCLVAQNLHVSTGLSFYKIKTNFNIVDTAISQKETQLSYQSSLILDYITKKNIIYRATIIYGSSSIIRPISYKKNNITQYQNKYEIKKNYIGYGIGFGKKYMINKFMIKNLIAFTFTKLLTDSLIFRSYQFGNFSSETIYYNVKTPYNQIHLLFETAIHYKLLKNFFIGLKINSGLEYIWAIQKQFEYYYYSDNYQTIETNTISYINNKNLRYNILNYQLLICYTYK